MDLKSIFGELRRVTSLSLTAHPDCIEDEDDLAIRFTGAKATSLKHLELCGITLAQGSFSKEILLLEQLVLEHCSFSLDQTTFLGLGSLTIINPRSRIQVDNFLSLVLHMSKLSVLSLYAALFRGDVAAGSDDPASLLNLSSISIQDETAVSHLLERVKLSSSANLVISMGGEDGFHNLPHAFANCRDSQWDLMDLHIAQTGKSATLKAIWIHDDEGESTASVTMIRPSYASSRFSTQMVLAMDIRHLYRLEISEQDPDNRDWRHIFGGLHCLRVIKVWNKTARSFLKFLINEEKRIIELDGDEAQSDEAGDIPSADDDDDDNEFTEEQEARLDHLGITFRSLRELIVIFDEGNQIAPHSRSIDEVDFGSALALRKRYGVRLRRFVHSGWSLSNLILWALTGFIPIVEDTHDGEGW